MARGPGVTVGRSGASFGVVSYSPVDFWPLNTALYVVDFHGNHERFAYYLLKQFDFSTYNSGSAQPSLNRNFVHPVPVHVPPMSEQQAIAQILGALDDKIELNWRMSETLEAMARALFKSWFVDFDPVRAQIDGRKRDLRKPIAKVSRGNLQESTSGSIPQGRKMGRLSDVADVIRDQENPLDLPDALFHHYSIPAFDAGQRPAVEHGGDIKSLKFRVPVGTVLLSKLNPEIERVWLPDVKPRERSICSTEFLVLRAIAPFTSSYVYCLARSAGFRRDLQALTTGTSKSHQRAHVQAVLEIGTFSPPAEVVAAFEESAGSLLDRSLACRREAGSLAALRDALLPKLVSGELRVPDTERMVGRHV